MARVSVACTSVARASVARFSVACTSVARAFVVYASVVCSTKNPNVNLPKFLTFLFFCL